MSSHRTLRTFRRMPPGKVRVRFVRRTATAENGDIVVALIGEEATVKRIFVEKDHIRLQPENDEFEFPCLFPPIVSFLYFFSLGLHPAGCRIVTFSISYI